MPTTTKPADQSTLDLALLVLQAQLPKAKKAGTAQYGSYITLEDLTEAVFQRLTEVGLTYSTVPRLHEPTGKPVLHCWLTHAATGQAKEGDWPLPDSTDPQRLGSAITYGRRYMLTALTGVVADRDDDGARAHQPDRDWVAEAEKETTADGVRSLWGEAKAAGASGTILERIAEIGAGLAAKQDQDKAEEGKQ